MASVKKKGRGESPTSPRMVDAATKQAMAMELRRGGATYQEIADALGYAAPSGARQAVEAALAKTIQEPAAELRQLEMARLDAMFMAVYPLALKGIDGKIDMALKIMARRAKLVGLDAPTATRNFNVDLTALTEDQLERLARGEELLDVLSAG